MQTNFQLRIFPCGPLATNAYLITKLGSQEAILIDAPYGIGALLEPILSKEHLILKAIILTHGHWDHIAEAEVLRQKTHAVVYGHAADQLFFSTPEMMSFSIPSGIKILPVEGVHFLKQGDTITLLGDMFHIRHVPGHAPGNILVYHPGLGAFVGDALFRRSIGRTDLPLSSPDELLHAIRHQIYTLPPETIVYPGHGDKTTVDEEICYNPYCRL